MSPADLSQLSCITGIYYGLLTNSQGVVTPTPKVCKVVIGQDGRMAMAVLTGHYEEVMIDTVKPTEVSALATSAFTITHDDSTLRYTLDSTRYNADGTVKDAFHHYVHKADGDTRWTLWSTFFSVWTPGTLGCVVDIAE